MVGFQGGSGTGEVRLRSSDPNDHPIIDPNYLSRPFGRRVAIEAVRETLELLNIPTIAKDRIDYVIGPKGDTDEEFWVCPCLSLHTFQKLSLSTKLTMLLICRTSSPPTQHRHGTPPPRLKWESLISHPPVLTRTSEFAGFKN